MIYQNPLALIGNTPLVKITRLTPMNSPNIFLKLEACNLTGSVKDRPALQMIEAAERAGTLKRGSTIIESTSGNLGVSLAAIAAYKGYTMICVVDPKIEETTRNMMKAFGARIVQVDIPDTQGGYQKPRIAKVQELLNTIPDAVNLDQYNNPENPHGHTITTGPELYRELRGTIDVLVGSVSTGGTLCGTARYLKEKIKHLCVIGVEPEGSVLFGGSYMPYLQQGAGLSFTPNNYDPSVIDTKIKVRDEDAFSTAYMLARREGLLVGGSAGGVLFATMTIVKRLPSMATVVCILPDGGNRYLTTFYSDQWLQQHKMIIPV